MHYLIILKNAINGITVLYEKFSFSQDILGWTVGSILIGGGGGIVVLGG